MLERIIYDDPVIGALMKPITRDITITLVIKMILLFVLWWVCIKTIHPVIESRSNWMFGATQSSSANIYVQRVKS